MPSQSPGRAVLAVNEPPAPHGPECGAVATPSQRTGRAVLAVDEPPAPHRAECGAVAMPSQSTGRAVLAVNEPPAQERQLNVLRLGRDAAESSVLVGRAGSLKHSKFDALGMLGALPQRVD